MAFKFRKQKNMKEWGGVGIFGALEPLNFCCGVRCQKPFSTWNKNADSGKMEPWSEAMERMPRFFGL